MEQDVHTGFNVACCTCLSGNRDLFSLNTPVIRDIFKLIMQDFEGNKYGEILDMEQLICWECLALMKKFFRFKNQVHRAQEHIRVLAMGGADDAVEQPFMSQSLSSLEACSKQVYDKIFIYYTQDEWPQSLIVEEVGDVKSEHYDAQRDASYSLDFGDHVLEVPEMMLENPVTGVMSRIVVGTDAIVTTAEPYRVDMDSASIKIIKTDEVITSKPKPNTSSGYITEYMSETDMINYRKELKLKVQYAASVYKCELCVIGFYTQQQVEEHFISHHSAKPGKVACKICYVYVDEDSLNTHTENHYLRYVCRFCGHVDHVQKFIARHMTTHTTSQANNAVIKIGTSKSKKKKDQERKSTPKSGDLRKLLSKTTIEGYPCLECDMFFKNSRARNNHVARFHREGFQCDHCKKKFVNRTTLATHLKLHEGPLPREECNICHKMVRVIQLKYHIQRHENKKRYECSDCQKVFSHLATYQAHLKYSRAHANDSVLKFPCPMCNKGYPTKEAMQDHFNYQHLGKTAHKCPICDKPIATKANVEKHMMRIHGQKKEKPRNHICQNCGKAFMDKKALTQHEVIHSGDRPLSCDICQQTFKQKASLYTHKKRVHQILPPKKMVQYMEPK